MTKIFAILGAMTMFLGACSDTSGKNSDRRTATVEGSQITWADYQKVAPFVRGKIPLAAGESVYLFSKSPVQGTSVKLSNGMVATSGQGGTNCYFLLKPEDPNWTKIVNECENTLNKRLNAQTKKMPFKRFVELAERGVRAEGGCRWVGYSAAFDKSVRAIGGVARMSDTRLFFAKLVC